MANYVEKESVLIRVAKYLFPWKGDKPAEIIRKIIFLSAAVVLVVTLVILISNAGSQAADNKQNESLSDLYHSGNASGSATLQINDEKREEIKKENPNVLDEFVPLLNENPDIVGWLSVGDPDDPWIDYPVMQGDDNSYYLDHDFYGNESKSGALFADYHDQITAEEQPANIVIYGHNMATGEYFGRLPYYFNYGLTNGDPNDISFYTSHPTITFSTLYKKSTYKIFGGILVNTEEEAGEVFNYHTVRNFDNKSEFDEYCAKILDRSTFINPDVNLKYGDNLITLSTCMFGYGDTDLRWVIFARETREGEKPEVDVSKAYANPDPLFYELYYEIYGGKWEGRKWSKDIIQGFKG